MAEESVKYVFLDIVAFTKDRSVEAQSDLISQLNLTVYETLKKIEIDMEKVILLPTGDGICVAIIAVTTPYDVHIRLALCILSLIQGYNDVTTDDMRKFQVRVGINENVDNLVIDVNDNKNVAGLGINMAQRIMNCADGGQILVGQTVFENLRAREKYMSKFRPFAAVAKHGFKFTVYQYIDNNAKGLNINIPEVFRPIKESQKLLTELVAYYMAFGIKYNDFFFNQRQDPHIRYVGPIILYFLACDAITVARKSRYDDIEGYLKTWNKNKEPIDVTWAHYCRIDFSVLTDFSMLIEDMYLGSYSDCFAEMDKLNSYIFVNDKGKQRLKKERPEIWSEVLPS